ncbi:hypothetical protein [Larkinella arboricola]|uniref:hypothetical protein n=1 Tax=Larkinella arboricola TaxID=643671 RepID=UPI0011BA8055|nr:hypothetical protein [Larkinella arboricola]
MIWFNDLIQLLRQNGRLIGAAILVLVIGGAVGYLASQRQLQACQAERVELLKAATAAEAFRQATIYGQKLKEKDLLLQEKENENLELRKKAALDSADRLSLIESMRAVNGRYNGRN